MAIGLGSSMAFLICVCSSATDFALQLVFLGIIWAAGVLGGRTGGQNPRAERPAYPAPAAYEPVNRFGSAPAASGGTAAPGSKPDTYYQMGVQAALGGRREEARQHFTRVLQIQPRSIAAWLQLANLADTPEQAWNYVQQARSINAADPAVLHAVDLIWPKVAAKAQQSPPPQAQPPYVGGGQDEVEIPRLTLPDSAPLSPPDIVAPPADDAGETPDVGSDEPTV